MTRIGLRQGSAPLIQFFRQEKNMEAAAAILLKAIVDNNTGLKAKVNLIGDPRLVEETLKPYYKAALSMVKKVSSGEA